MTAYRLGLTTARIIQICAAISIQTSSPRPSRIAGNGLIRWARLTAGGTADDGCGYLSQQGQNDNSVAFARH
jgi:hypothetical protein